jgi:hypothetical protein
METAFLDLWSAAIHRRFPLRKLASFGKYGLFGKSGDESPHSTKSTIF